MRVYAHRGASYELPENTMPAFARALELGADALETDVHLTRDGVLVAAHDCDGLRMCNARHLIRESAWDEVRTWDAGYGWVAPDGTRPFVGRGFRIPRLEELVTTFPVTINVDMKQDRPPLHRELCALVERLGAWDRVQIASFHARPLWALRRLGRRATTSLSPPEVAALLALPTPAFRVLVPGARLAQLPVRQGRLVLARPWLIERCRAAGLRAEFFTVNDAALARELLALGADAVMTDDPATVVPAVRGTNVSRVSS